MWLFTRYGFFSVTVSRQDPYKMQIRARAKEDLERLAEFAATQGWHIGEHFSEIIETPNADYRWRIICVPGQWAAIAEALAADVDYHNFKATITDPKRHRLYERVWHTMLDLQYQEEANRLQVRFDLDDLADDPALWDFGRVIVE